MMPTMTIPIMMLMMTAMVMRMTGIMVAAMVAAWNADRAGITMAAAVQRMRVRSECRPQRRAE